MSVVTKLSLIDKTCEVVVTFSHESIEFMCTVASYEQLTLDHVGEKNMVSVTVRWVTFSLSLYSFICLS